MVGNRGVGSIGQAAGCYLRTNLPYLAPERAITSPAFSAASSGIVAGSSGSSVKIDLERCGKPTVAHAVGRSVCVRPFRCNSLRPMADRFLVTTDVERQSLRFISGETVLAGLPGQLTTFPIPSWRRLEIGESRVFNDRTETSDSVRRRLIRRASEDEYRSLFGRRLH